MDAAETLGRRGNVDGVSFWGSHLACQRNIHVVTIY